MFNSYDNRTYRSERPLCKLAFDSISEMLDKCTQAANNGKAHRKESDDFVGRHFKNWDDIALKANQPWTEGLDEVQDMLFQIQREGHTFPPPMDTGDDLSYDRLKNGQSDYWIKTERQLVQSSQYVTIISDVSTSAWRDWKDILWRGAASMIISDLLEASGYRVEMYAVNWCQAGLLDGTDMFISLKLKDASAYADTVSVCNALSGWFYRTCIFQSYYTQPKKPCSSLGFPMKMNLSDAPIQELTGPGSTPILISNVWSLKDSLAKVREIITKVNEGTLMEDK